jgi:hypothetical protein
MSNRQRIANLAKLNASDSSIKSGSEDLKDASSSFSKKIDRKKVSGSRTAGRGRRSKSPALECDDDDNTIVSSASVASSKPSSGRSSRESRTTGRTTTGSGSRRGSSRSRSKSRHRSKSAKSRPRRRNPPSRTPSGGGSSTGEMDVNFNTSSSFIPPISPVQSQSNGHRSVARSPTSGKSEASKLSLSEMELINFLGDGSTTPTNSERMSRSVPTVDLGEHSGRASRTTGNRRTGGSTRRERTVGSNSRSKEHSSSVRDRSESNLITSSSSYKRPPRTNRGVGRSQSGTDALLSPRKTVSRNGSGAKHGDPSRGVRRAKSTDDMGDLNTFFSKDSSVSRRTRPGSSAKSVASMPTGNRRNNRRKGDNDPTKPPSSRSTVSETDSYYSDEEDESINESLEDLNDTRSYPNSNRSVESPNDIDEGSYNQQSFQNLNMEAALQMHMNRTENLLFDVFPKHVAEALRSGRKVEPENHEEVTIFFCDIVGFTTISSELDPMKISDLLDRLYNSFDALSHYHDVFKVETIGDAYVSNSEAIGRWVES